MIEYFYAVLLLLSIILILFLLDQLGLWMERKGWFYYRNSEPKGTTGVGNALHELNSIFDSTVKSQDEIREEMQQEEQESGDEIDEDIKTMIKNVRDEKKDLL